ncbi:MAG: hypothetical protein QXX95_05220 [Nitrososphaerales archaeon]
MEVTIQDITLTTIKNGIKTILRVRKNSISKINGCYARNLAVMEQKRLKPKA